MKMKVPKKCPICGLAKLYSEEAIIVNQHYLDGKFKECIKIKPIKELWCWNCGLIGEGETIDSLCACGHRNLTEHDLFGCLKCKCEIGLRKNVKACG